MKSVPHANQKIHSTIAQYDRLAVRIAHPKLPRKFSDLSEEWTLALPTYVCSLFHGHCILKAKNVYVLLNIIRK